MGTCDPILQTIFNDSALGIAQIGLDGKCLRVNPRYCQLLGYGEEELRTREPRDIIHPDDLDRSVDGLRQLLDGSISSHSMEGQYIRGDGTVFWGRLHRSLVRGEDNEPKFIVAVLEDVTDRVRTERTLRDGERLLVLTLRSARLGLWDRDMRTGKTVVSGEYASVHGLRPDQLPIDHETWLNLVHPDDRDRVEAEYQENIRRASFWDTEFRLMFPDGSVHWLLSKGQVFRDESGAPIRLAGVNLDITERKRVEEALRESNERFRRLFEEGPLGLALVGTDFRFQKVNSTLCRMVGYSEAALLARSFADITYGDDLQTQLDLTRRLFRREIPSFRLRERYVKTDLKTIWVSLTASLISNARGEPLHGLFMIEDITEMKRTQEEAIIRQKLEGLGLLAGGIAHDFNNLLGSILTEAELAQSDLGAGNSPSEEIARIKTVAIRGSEIVRQLMIFAGQGQSSTLEPIALSRLTEEMLELTRASISKYVVLQADLDENLPDVWGNPPQLRQVLLNLVINASEAIGDREGLIRVRTSRVGSGRDVRSNDLPLAAVDYVQLEVADTGCGLTEEAKSKIFDPFFSTKFAGRGLGLALVQGIVRAHGGAIDVVSTPGRGTSFLVRFPCVPDVTQVQNTTRSPSAWPGNRLKA